MADTSKTKAQLIKELNEFRRKVQRLEAVQKNHKKVPANLLQREELFYRLTEYSPFPVIIYAPNGKTEYINPKFSELFGYTIKDITSRNVWRKEAYPDPHYRKQIEKEVKASESSERRGFQGSERRITCADGSEKEGMLYSLYLPDGRYYIIVADITDLKRSQNAVEENMARFRTVYKDSPVPAFLWKRVEGDFILIDYSNSAEEFTGGDLKDYIGSKFKPLFRDMPQMAVDAERCYSEQSVIHNEYPYRLRTTGEMRYVSSFYTFVAPDLSLIYLVDITEYKRIERSLRENEKRLEIEAKRLEEANTALKVLLDYRGKEKSRIQENVVTTVTQLILPFLEKLGESSITKEQRVFLETVKSNLAEITSPLATKLSYRYAGLSPTEFTVANLVREGKRIKEVADLLNVTEDTVRFHRKNIRTKLGIRRKKVNLHSYLQQLSNE